MLHDCKALEGGETILSDICIVGAGPAGITLARELSADRLRIVVVSGGGLEIDSGAQSLYRGSSDGVEYYPLDECRVRAFGGTTHTWGGWLRPLDASDFEVRDWIPHSGWPFDLRAIENAYTSARRLCSRFASDDWIYPQSSQLSQSSLQSSFAPELDRIIFEIAPIRFGETHRAALASAANVRVLLGAHALELSMEDNGRSIEAVHCATDEGRSFRIKTRCVVLAAGGIENARLLLTSTGHGECGLGNSRGLVGRFFGDHLHVPLGTLENPDCDASMFFQPHRVGRTRLRGGLRLNDAVRNANRLLGSAITLHNLSDPHDVLSPPQRRGGYDSMMVLGRGLLNARLPSAATAHAFRMIRHLDEAAFR